MFGCKMDEKEVEKTLQMAIAKARRIQDNSKHLILQKCRGFFKDLYNMSFVLRIQLS